MYYENMLKLKDQYHPQCILNSELFEFKMSFNEIGELSGTLFCYEKYQGYPGRIHGGVLAAIIDYTMTMCLFGHRIIAYTVRLNIKYSHPVVINKETVIHVILNKKEHNCVCSLDAAVFQDGKRKATASAQFWIGDVLNQEDI